MKKVKRIAAWMLCVLTIGSFFGDGRFMLTVSAAGKTVTNIENAENAGQELDVQEDAQPGAAASMEGDAQPGVAPSTEGDAAREGGIPEETAPGSVPDSTLGSADGTSDDAMDVTLGFTPSTEGAAGWEESVPQGAVPGSAADAVSENTSGAATDVTPGGASSDVEALGQAEKAIAGRTAVIEPGIAGKTGEKAVEDGKGLIKGVELLRMDGTPIADGDGIKFDETFLVQLSFVDLVIKGVTPNCVPGTTYLLLDASDMPVELMPEGGADFSWTSTLDDGTSKFGDGSYKTDNTVLLRLADAFTGEYTDRITAPFIRFSARLDAAKCGPDQGLELKFHLNGTAYTFPVALTDNIPTPPAVDKTGSYDTASNRINWSVTVTEGTKGYPDGWRFEDIISDNQAYAAGTFQVTQPDGTVASPAVSVSGNALSYGENPGSGITPTGNKDDKWTITYETELKASALVTGGKVENGKKVSVNAANEARLYDKADNSLIASKKAEFPIDKTYTWMSKTGSVTNPATGEITWTITVNANGYSFHNVTVYDRVEGKPKNSPASEIYFKELNAGGALVTYGAADLSNPVATDTKTEGGQTYSMKLDLGALNGSADRVITYKTYVDNYDEYIKYNQDKIKNSAWMAFDWDYDGTGIEHPVGVPVMSVDQGIAAGAIGKECMGYEAKSHRITWKVTVNSAKAALSDVTVKDILGGAPGNKSQSYVEIKEAKIDGADYTLGADKIDTATDSGAVTVDFGNDLKGKTATFVLVTELTDPEYYENNRTDKTAETFYNKAELYSGTNKLSDAQASVKPTQTVLDKKDPVYNYATKTVPWEIEVNQDRMALQDPTVTDVIPAGLLLQTGTLKVDGASIPERNSSGGTKPYYTYDTVSQELVVFLTDFAEGDAPKKISFDTSVDVDNAVFVNGGVSKPVKSYNGNITVSNEAKLKTAQNGDGTTDGGSAAINNKVLNKTGTPDNAIKGRIYYQVFINQPGSRLSDGTAITDVLSPGLLLNLSSLKLYEASVATDGSVIKGVERTDFTYETEILGTGSAFGAEGATRLTLTLPQNAGTKVFLLEYNASASDKTQKNYTNDIKMTGLSAQSTGTKVNLSNSQIFGSGGGGGSSVSTVEIQKADAADNKKALAGAVFELSYQGHVVGTAETGADGKAYFNDLEPGIQYTVTEKTAPAGYSLTAVNAVTFTAAERGWEKRAVLTFENELLKTELTFTKVDEKNDALQGARFGLFRLGSDGVTETKLAEAYSDTAGKVLFSGVTQGIYRLRELSAPEDYLINANVIVAEVDINAAVTAFYLEGDAEKKPVTKFESQPKPAGTVNFIKTDEAGKPLAGAEFEIFKTFAGTEKPVQFVLSDGSGQVVFSGLREGTYHIKEKTAPEGYEKNEDLILVAEIGTDGAVNAFYDSMDSLKKTVTTVINQKLPAADIVFRVRGREGRYLRGAVFGLFCRIGENEEKVAETASDEDGAVTFENVRKGTYYIRQLTSEQGYSMLGKPMILTVDDNGKVISFYEEGTEPGIAAFEVVNKKQTEPEKEADTETKTEPETGTETNTETEAEANTGTGGEPMENGSGTDEPQPEKSGWVKTLLRSPQTGELEHMVTPAKLLIAAAVFLFCMGLGFYRSRKKNIRKEN